MCQAYEAGNMAGANKGLAADINHLNSKALYMHCLKHQLNLREANIFKIATAHNLMQRIREITGFFNYSQTREQV